MKGKWGIISPVYNDWDCANRMLEEISQTFPSANRPEIFFINDGSSTNPSFNPPVPYEGFQVIELTRNLGHQKAIAIGLSFVQANFNFDFVVVIDSDGEDRPQDIQNLINAHLLLEDDKVVFAHRKRRHEGLVFKSLYYIYRLLFRLLTGERIAFGNFCLIPGKQLNRVVHVSEIWNHFSGGVIRSKIPFTTIPVDRGKRYFGTSKMNFTALIIHGISSITVHLDVVAVRLLMSSALSVLAMLSGFAWFVWRNIVSWNRDQMLLISSGLILVALLVIILFVALSLTFNVLFYRIQKPFVPAREFTNFISK